MCWIVKKCYYRLNQKVLKFAMCFMNWKEPELLEGENAVLKLPAFIKSKGITKVLVVTDKGLMNLHILDPLFKQLEKEGVEYVVYDEVQPNPTIPNIEKCKDKYISQRCEGIIAFGGGSPMDCAKAAAARVVKPTIRSGGLQAVQYQPLNQCKYLESTGLQKLLRQIRIHNQYE